MKRYILTIFLSILSFGSIAHATAPFIFTSGQVGATPVSGYYLKTDGTNSTWAAVSSGGSTGLATTSPWIAGQVPVVSSNSAVYSIATSTPTVTYPVQYSGTLGSFVGGSTGAFSLAFGTSTSNTWGGTQTFTNTPVLGALSGFIAGNNGSLYQIASSSLNLPTNALASTNVSQFTNDAGYLTAAITAIGPAGQTQTGATQTLATSTSAFDGLTPKLVITATGNTQTFTSSLSGTLTVAGGGTGKATLTASQLLYGNGTAALSSVGTTTLSLSGFPANIPATLGALVGGSNTTWTYWGLATSSAIVSGQPLYATGVNTIASVASSTFLASIGGQATGNYITALTGDVTASGPGSVAATLATVNSNVGTFTYPSVTVNGKGLVTAISNGTAPTTYTATYPITLTGSALGLAFGTTTANNWSALQQFNGNASTTGFTDSGTEWLTALGTSAGALLAVDPNGKVIATTTLANYWTLSGGNIYNNTGTNVGIGTTSPIAQFSVANSVLPANSIYTSSGAQIFPVSITSFDNTQSAGTNTYASSYIVARTDQTSTGGATDGLITDVYDAPTAAAEPLGMTSDVGIATHLTPTNIFGVSGGNFTAYNASNGSTVLATAGNNFTGADTGIGATSTILAASTNTITQTGAYDSAGTGIVVEGLINNNSATANITNAYGFKLNNLINTGTIGSTYGVWTGTLTAGTQTNTPYSFYASDPNAYNYFAGNTGIGSTSPSAALSINGSISATNNLPSIFGTTSPLNTFFNLIAADNFWVATSTAANTAVRALAITGSSAASGGNAIQGFNASAIFNSSATANNTVAIGSGGAGGLRGGRMITQNDSSGYNVLAQTDIEAVTAVQGTLASTTAGIGFFANAPVVGSGDLLSNFYGVRVHAASIGAGTLTSQAGLDVGELTAGTNNTGLLLGTETIPTGNYGLYDGSASNNYFASNTGIGSTTPWATASILSSSLTVPALAVSTTTGKDVLRIDAQGHRVTGGYAPSCGTGCSTVSGDDSNMRVKTGSGVTSVTVNFAAAFKNVVGTSVTPVCIAADESGGTTVADASSTPTTVVIGLSASLTTKFLAVHCEASDNFTF